MAIGIRDQVLPGDREIAQEVGQAAAGNVGWQGSLLDGWSRQFYRENSGGALLRGAAKVGARLYRIASIGDSRDARTAGYNPNSTASSSAIAQAAIRPIGLTTSP